jgi:hypothetical protein
MRRTPSALLALCVFALVVFAIPLASQVMPSKPPDLDPILQRIEDAQRQNSALSRPYEVTREYKVFRGNNTQAISQVVAQIDFVPPDTKTCKITQTSGNSWGIKIVRDLLDSETASTRKAHSTEITRANYDFAFLRQQNSEDAPEYVLAISPKRKDKYLLRGQIWVDTHTFRIRQIEGVPARSPSFWLKELHVTLQYGELGGIWVPVKYGAIAKIRFLGEFTLDGISVQQPESKSAGHR